MQRALLMRELATASGVTHQTIYRLEHGQREAQPRTVRRLAEALGVTPDDIRKRD